jgi:hypothetical protein
MNPLTQSKNTTILPVLIALTLACFAFSPQARAVCQEGCDTATGNTFLGEDALINNPFTGTSNTAIGGFALTSNTDGAANTAIGSAALFSNTIGSDNTATGVFALRGNTTGSFNTATGQNALVENTIGSDNTAIGYNALSANLTGNFNTASGRGALRDNTTGNFNTASGFGALASNPHGSLNTATGYNALVDNNGSNNIALGASAGINLTTGSNNIDIGNGGVGDESATIRIGTEQRTTYIAGIREAPVAQGVAVAVGITADGQLGVRASSVRFKDSVKPMDKASEAIFSLQPVTFRYKNDPAALPQFGLVAEEVAKINPDLVAPDVEGKPFTVRYDEINAMLLNEFLKARRQIDSQQKQIEALTAGLQKVSAQLEVSKSAPRTALNSQ